MATAAVLVVATGWGTGNGLYASVRGAAYLALGTLAAIGTIGSGADDEGGADSAGAAAAAVPLLVALGEASERGLVWLLVTQTTAAIPSGKWEIGLAKILASVQTEWMASHAALAVACVAAIPGAHRVGGARGAVTWLAAVTVGWVLLLGADLGSRAAALAALVP
ncbi:MAG: hypothetical protein KC621_16530, partial [Myxococcales bacterium]|nr:hypothetical protein [Myxococcales bacterium]